jgi:DNA-binding PadR family transcriptional regulator
MPMKHITRLEEIILTTILRLEEEAYGVAIRQKVVELTNEDLIYGTLYNTLDQLFRKGYVQKKRGKPTPERGGRGKIYYSLTSQGIDALRESRKLHEKLWKGLKVADARKGDRS